MDQIDPEVPLVNAVFAGHQTQTIISNRLAFVFMN